MLRDYSRPWASGMRTVSSSGVQPRASAANRYYGKQLRRMVLPGSGAATTRSMSASGPSVAEASEPGGMTCSTGGLADCVDMIHDEYPQVSLNNVEQVSCDLRRVDGKVPGLPMIDEAPGQLRCRAALPWANRSNWSVDFCAGVPHIGRTNTCSTLGPWRSSTDRASR